MNVGFPLRIQIQVGIASVGIPGFIRSAFAIGISVPTQELITGAFGFHLPQTMVYVMLLGLRLENLDIFISHIVMISDGVLNNRLLIGERNHDFISFSRRISGDFAIDSDDPIGLSLNFDFSANLGNGGFKLIAFGQIDPLMIIVDLLITQHIVDIQGSRFDDGNRSGEINRTVFSVISVVQFGCAVQRNVQSTVFLLRRLNRDFVCQRDSAIQALAVGPVNCGSVDGCLGHICI